MREESGMPQEGRSASDDAGHDNVTVTVQPLPYSEYGEFATRSTSIPTSHQFQALFPPAEGVRAGGETSHVGGSALTTEEVVRGAEGAASQAKNDEQHRDSNGSDGTGDIGAAEEEGFITNKEKREYAVSEYENKSIAQSNPNTVAEPPTNVMTALGPLPLPPEIRAMIPKKFEANPIIEEREIYVAKKEIEERTIEIPHVQYEHRFKEIPKTFVVEKLVPIHKEIIKEIPREIYKPVVEEKVIEVPQGVKYVEVPVEVPCLYPPKIVPRPRIQYVERVIETVKPIVKQKIIEVPQTVIKEVPKVKIVEVPYYVPRYIEKLVEVPYRPPDASQLPNYASAMPVKMRNMMPGNMNQGGNFPPSFAGAPLPNHPFTLGPLPMSSINQIDIPYEAKIDVKITQPEVFEREMAMQQQMNMMMNRTTQQMGGSNQAMNIFGGQQFSDDQLDGKIDLPKGYKWGSPPNAPQRLNEAGGGMINSCCPAPPPMKPLLITCPPEIGNVKFAANATEPDILTKLGVGSYSAFKRGGHVAQIFPPLPPIHGVAEHPQQQPPQ